MIFLLSFIIPVLAFIFESYPRFLNRKFGVDIWTHLLYLKEYHRQKGIPKRIENGFLVPGTYDYPPTFIFILSKFPFKLVEKYEFLFSPFFDATHIILIFFITYLITQNIAIAFLTQTLYVLTPIIVLENSSATPRSLGYTLFSILFISLFLFIENGNPTLLVIAIVAGTLVFLSHRFTTQGFLFFVLFFTVLEQSPLYIVVFLVSFIFAVIVSGGFYLKVLRGHIGNLIFWYKNINFRFAHQVKGNYRSHKTQDFIFKLYNQFLKFPPFVLIITNPWTVPVFYLFLFAFPAQPILQKFVWWVIVSYVLSIATIWLPRLRFLGEGQRYLELSAFPAAMLSAKLFVDMLQTELPQLAVLYYAIIGVLAFITTVVIQKKGIIKDSLRTVTPSLNKMFAYLRTVRPKPKLLCIPHQITTSTIYHTGCPVFVNADYTNIEKISEVYPYLTKPVRLLMDRYNLDMILLNEEYARVTDLKLAKYEIINKVDNFLLIKPL